MRSFLCLSILMVLKDAYLSVDLFGVIMFFLAMVIAGAQDAKELLK